MVNFFFFFLEMENKLQVSHPKKTPILRSNLLFGCFRLEFPHLKRELGPQSSWRSHLALTFYNSIVEYKHRTGHKKLTVKGWLLQGLAMQPVLPNFLNKLFTRST